MTKKEFANQIFQIVQNGLEADDADETIIDDVEIFLDRELQPRDREAFAKWGHPEHQTTPERCWA